MSRRGSIRRPASRAWGAVAGGTPTAERARGRCALGLLVGLASLLSSPAASAAPRAEADAPPLAEAEIVAGARAAGRLYGEGRYAEALTLMRALAIRLEQGDRLAEHPVVPMLVGRCLDRLDRPREALAAFDRVLALVPADADGERGEVRRAATAMRARLLAERFGALTARCAPPHVAARLEPDGDHRPCPAEWPRALAGPQRVGFFTPGGATPVAVVEVEVPAGGRVRVDSPVTPTPPAVLVAPPARWRFGARVGAGVGVTGSNPYLEGGVGSAWSASVYAARALGAAGFGARADLGLGFVHLPQTLTGRFRAGDPPLDADDAGRPFPRAFTWQRLTLEAAALAEWCLPVGAGALCPAVGPGVEWAVWLRDDGGAWPDATPVVLDGVADLEWRIEDGGLDWILALRGVATLAPGLSAGAGDVPLWRGLFAVGLGW